MGEAHKIAYTKLDTTGNVAGVALEDFGEFSAKSWDLKTFGTLKRNGQMVKLPFSI